MCPVLLPTLEDLGRRALVRRGARSVWYPTTHGLLHCYDVQGHGTLPDVVLLHGLATSATSFAPLLHQLKPHFGRVVAPDHLGHGFSGGRQRALGAEEVRGATTEVLLRCIGEPAILVGNSMGGALAVDFAMHHPDRVRGLVLVSPAGAPFSEPEWQELRAAFDVVGRGGAMNFFHRIYRRPPWVLKLIAHELPAHFRRPALRALLGGSAPGATSSPVGLAGLRMPVLVLWGAADRLLPPSHLEYFRKHLPAHARFEQPPDFGHSPHLDSTRALADYIVRFGRLVASAAERAAP